LRRKTAENRKGLLTAKLGASGRFPPLLRARRLDDWAREFLARHPDASVLHLGCGWIEQDPSYPQRHAATPLPVLNANQNHAQQADYRRQSIPRTMKMKD
jgi:hypothetical protein